MVIRITSIHKIVDKNCRAIACVVYKQADCEAVSNNRGAWINCCYILYKLSSIPKIENSIFLSVHSRQTFLDWKVNLSDWIFNLGIKRDIPKIENPVWKIDFSIQKSLPWVHTQKDWIFNLWNLESTLVCEGTKNATYVCTLSMIINRNTCL